MKKKLYFVIASVLFISIILLSISYAKESKYEKESSTYEINEKNIKIIYQNNNHFKLNKNFINNITIINKDSKEITYGIFINGIDNQEHSDIYYSINDKNKEKIKNGIIYIGTLTPFGTSNDLNSHSLKIYANKELSNQEYTLEVRLINRELLSELIIIDKNTYKENNNYRYFGEDVNNYLTYENQLYRIIGIINNKIRLISEPKVKDKFKNTYKYLTIEDYIASFNDLNARLENALNYKSWLTTENYYLINKENKPFIIDKNNGIISPNTLLKYDIREVIEIDSNAKVVKGDGTLLKPYEVTYES